jgi:16S rRNA processing protein RimM
VPDDLVVVARLVRVRGLRGELVADLLTDFPDRFEGLESIIGVAPDGELRSLQIEEHWFHQHRIVFKFAGYDSIEAAQDLVGYQLAVPENERVELPSGHFYDWELAGCEVINTSGENLGRVREVMRTGGVELLVVEGRAVNEFLIPMAEDICVEIDVDKKIIRVDPPEGLLEL